MTRTYFLCASLEYKNVYSNYYNAYTLIQFTFTYINACIRYMTYTVIYKPGTQMIIPANY